MNRSNSFDQNCLVKLFATRNKKTMRQQVNLISKLFLVCFKRHLKTHLFKMNFKLCSILNCSCKINELFKSHKLNYKNSICYF